MRRNIALEEVIAPVVQGLGYTFVGLQYLPQGGHSVLRVYVDKPGGIDIDECARISRQIDAVMEVRAPIQGRYTLEVSSPGLDRLLFTPTQFFEQRGKMVSIRIAAPIEGRRNFKGILESVEPEGVTLRMEDNSVNSDTVKLAFIDIVEARLVPEW
jgi:ribosome maturation factor RimP